MQEEKCTLHPSSKNFHCTETKYLNFAKEIIKTSITSYWYAKQGADVKS